MNDYQMFGNWNLIEAEWIYLHINLNTVWTIVHIRVNSVAILIKFSKKWIINDYLRCLVIEIRNWIEKLTQFYTVYCCTHKCRTVQSRSVAVFLFPLISFCLNDTDVLACTITHYSRISLWWIQLTRQIQISCSGGMLYSSLLWSWW